MARYGTLGSDLEINDDGVDIVELKQSKSPLRGKIEFMSNPLLDIIGDLKLGKAVVITREDKTRWSMRIIKTGEFSMVHDTMSMQEYAELVYTPAYNEFMAEWKVLSSAEKWVRCKGLEWNHVKDPKIDLMRGCEALQKSLGIEKYKPEWQSSLKRSAVKPRARW